MYICQTINQGLNNDFIFDHKDELANATIRITLSSLISFLSKGLECLNLSFVFSDICR